jgi:hypothetical protein
MAQKFTVDPLLLQGSTSNTAVDLSTDADADDGDSDDSSDEELQLTPEQKKAADRKAMLERLSKEYEEAVKEAADGGCTMCSS